MSGWDFIKKHSENIAGVISLIGSTAVAFAGGLQSLAAAAVFTVAELTLAKSGHKMGGYATGAALMAAGDLTLAFSKAVEDGSPLQSSLFCMTGAWAVGALRYPFAKAAEFLQSPRLQKIADTLPAVCGTANLLLRLPGIFAAAHDGKKIMTGAIAAWGVADVLSGRLQERAVAIYRHFRKKTPAIQG